MVSYLVARPSHDVILAARQQTTQQLWTEYADNFEFILEECYRMKEAFAAKFNSMQELYDYLVAETEKNKALGWKYLPPPQPQNEDDKEV